MSDAPPTVIPSAPPSDARTLPVVIYGLYLAGFVSGGLTTLIGFVMAMTLRDEGSPMQQSHYQFQVRSVLILMIVFMAAIGLILAGFPLALILVGVLFWIAGGVIIGALGLWFGLRCVFGLTKVLKHEAIPQPRTWLI
jgi:uncharacterized membrane protein